MVEKLVSPGPKNFTEGSGISRQGATWMDALTKQINRLRGIKTVTTADASSPAGTQALANALKAKLNQVLYALGAEVQDDDAPTATPEEEEASLPPYVQVKDVYSRDEVEPTFDSGATYSYAAGTAPDLASDRNRIDPETLDFRTLQSDGARLEIEYRAAVVGSGGKNAESVTVALLVDGVVTDWTLLTAGDNAMTGGNTLFLYDADNSSHTYSIALFLKDDSTFFEDWSRRILLIRERRNT